MIYIDATAVLGKAGAVSHNLLPSVEQNHDSEVESKALGYGSIPKHQEALVLNALRQPYQLVSTYSTPYVRHGDEMIIRTHTVGRELFAPHPHKT